MQALPNKFLDNISDNYRLSRIQKDTLIELFGDKNGTRTLLNNDFDLVTVRKNLSICETTLKSRLTTIYKCFKYIRSTGPGKLLLLYNFLLSKYNRSEVFFSKNQKSHHNIVTQQDDSDIDERDLEYNTPQPNFDQDILYLRTSLRKCSESTDELLSIFKITIHKITLKIKEILNAHRATVFFFNEEDQELSSLVAETDNTETPEINIPISRGFAGRAARAEKPINIPYDVYKHPDSSETKKQDKLNNYRTYTLLSFPLKDEQDNLIAVIQFLNKLKTNIISESPKTIPLEHQIDKVGFTEEDKRLLNQASPSICEVLKEFHDFYDLAYKIEMSQKRIEFTQSISEDNIQDKNEMLERLMEATRKPVNADRCTLWKLDSTKCQLYTKFHNDDQLKPQETTLNIKKHSSAIAVQVALTNKHRNIEYDFYDHEDAKVAKKLDMENKYRTCSLLCMPVCNTQGDVIAVTQLVNKIRKGNFPPYNHIHYPNPPARWKASFSRRDERRMKELNIQIAEVLERESSSEIEEKEKELKGEIEDITAEAAKLLSAERVTIFILNEEKTQLWSLIADDGQGESLDSIQIAVGEGLAGEAAQSQKIKKVDRDFHGDSRSSISKAIEPGFPIENAAAVPIISPDKDELIAIIELWNHRTPFAKQKKIAENGFSQVKLDEFQSAYSQNIAKRINDFSVVYRNIQQQRIIQTLHRAEHMITQSGLDQTNMFILIMKAARDMTSAHRITLWRIDKKNLQGQTIDDKGLKSLGVIPIDNRSIAGETALTESIINIPFDIYKDSRRSQTAQNFDKNNNYRTCSLLCVPIYDESNGMKKLVGILQLVNKVRNNRLMDDNHKNLSYSKEPPKRFRVSFTDIDEQRIEAFSRTVGTVLYKVLLEQELMELSLAKSGKVRNSV